MSAAAHFPKTEARGSRMPSGNGMIRTIWIIGPVVVLVPLLAAWRTEAGRGPLSKTKDVLRVDGGPNNPDLTRVSDQSPYIRTKR
jgi:hypothetical protein